MGADKFSFHIETKNEKVILTIIPKGIAPESTGAVQQAHAALAMPLRVTVNDTENIDQDILQQIEQYMMQRNEVKTQVSILTKTLSEASKGVKQEIKENDSKQKATTSGESKDKPVTDKQNTGEQSGKRKLEL